MDVSEGMIESVNRVFHSHGNTALLTVFTAYFIYYVFQVAHVPLFACGKGKWRKFLEKRMGVMRRRYWPTMWCVESHAHTFMASVLRARLVPNIQYQREVLSLSDGGQVALDWLFPKGTRHDAALITLFLPGLTGDSQADYIRPLVMTASNEGTIAVVFNNRGRGGLKLKTKRTYCAANCDDLGEVIAHIRKNFPDKPIMATGVSLGSMILGHYLVNEGSNAGVLCGLMVSPPFNATDGMKSLEKPFLNLQLNKHLTVALNNSIKMYHEQLESSDWDLEDVFKSRTIREFDARFTAPQFHFPSVDAYYEAASLHDKLHLIKVPVLCLCAADDPFQPSEILPISTIEEECSSVAMVLTSHGGHIGFMEGVIPRVSQQYMVKVYQEYLSAAMSNVDEVNNMKS